MDDDIMKMPHKKGLCQVWGFCSERLVVGGERPLFSYKVNVQAIFPSKEQKRGRGGCQATCSTTLSQLFCKVRYCRGRGEAKNLAAAFVNSSFL